MMVGVPIEQYLANLRRELAQVEDSLARPVEEGREWDRRRAELTRQEALLRARIRQVGLLAGPQK
jgi:phage shock protein A